MRIRTAKQRAQRIDLYYFTHARGMRRLRILLSAALPVAALLWIGGMAAAGSRQPYSAGPVSSAHAFAEAKCEVCHRSAAEHAEQRGMAAEHAEHAERRFRRHTTDGACLTCHDAPPHAANQTPPPSCAACHRDHGGRIQLAKMDDGFCVECHGELKTAHGDPRVAKAVRTFPSGHPEFAAVRAGAPPDPSRLRFNHAVHLKDDLRGPAGPEKLECSACHRPEIVRTAAGARKPNATGLMAPFTYQEQCARCHPLFFDERIEQPAPHGTPEHVRAFVRQSLAGYIAQHPHDISKADAARRVPLNFPRPAEPPAKTAAEWVERRAAVDERVLWDKTCAECHEPETAAVSGLPAYAPTRIPRQWMPRAAFNHTPHAVVNCESCHAARGSTKTSDVLLPSRAACAACHAPSRGALRLGSGRAESRCFECHRYHDWTKMHPVASSYSLTDFK